MVVIDTEQTRRALSFDAAIPALREAFRQGAHVPRATSTPSSRAARTAPR